MAITELKKAVKGEAELKSAHNAWHVMKPFVHFGIKATGLIAGTLIAIIKSIPKPANHEQPERKDDKITRI